MPQVIFGLFPPATALSSPMKTAFLTLSVVAMLNHPGVATAADMPPWSLDPEQLRIPDAPLQGRMPGCPDFKPGPPLHIGMNNSMSFVMKEDPKNTLTPQDTFSVSVTDRRLKLGPGLEGLRVKVAPMAVPAATTALDRDATSAQMSWRRKDNSRSGSDKFVNNFAMVLEFGSLTDGNLPVGIYLCLPDEGKTVLAGRFVITGSENNPLGLSSIAGSLVVPPAINEKVVFIGSLGPSMKDSLSSSGVEMDVSESGDWGYSTYSAGLLSVHVNKVRPGDYKLTNPRPGWHLVLIAAAEREAPKPQAQTTRPDFHDMFMAHRQPIVPLPRVYAAHWAEVKDWKSTVDCPLQLDPSLQGSVKVLVPGAREGTVVTFLPLTAQGIVPVPAAHGVSPYLRARTKDGATPTLSLVAGSYEFTCLGVKQNVKVERGKTKTIKFEL